MCSRGHRAMMSLAGHSDESPLSSVLHGQGAVHGNLDAASHIFVLSISLRGSSVFFRYLPFHGRVWSFSRGLCDKMGREAEWVRL